MPSKKDKYLAAAQKFAERGQLDKALLELGKVVHDDYKDTRTWLKIAELHAKRGENREAAEIYLRTGDLYAEQGAAQKAVAVYKSVLKLSPASLGVHQKLGALFQQLALVSDAVQQFELAAVGFQQAGQFPEAVAALRQAVALQPDSVVLRINLAESASQAGFTDEAVREFGAAADILKASGRIDEYVRVSERLLFHRPAELARAHELAEVYIDRGSPRLALPKLQGCLGADPGAPRTLSLLAKALEQLGQTAKAVSVLKELARAHDAAGRTTERDGTLARLLALAPGDRVLHALGEPRSAPLGWVSSPPSPVVARILAETEVFIKYELLERAAANLVRVFEIDPVHREARETLISVLTALHRTQDAARESLILAEQLAATSARDRQRPEQLDGPPDGFARAEGGDPNRDVLTPPALDLTADAELLEDDDEVHDVDDDLEDATISSPSSMPAWAWAGTLAEAETKSAETTEENVESFEIAFDLDSARHRAAIAAAEAAEASGAGPPARSPATSVSTSFDGMEDQVTPPPEQPFVQATEPAASVSAEMGPHADVLPPILRRPATPMGPPALPDGDEPASLLGRSGTEAGTWQARLLEADEQTVIDREHVVLADLIFQSEAHVEPHAGFHAESQSDAHDPGELVTGSPPEVANISSADDHATSADDAELETELELASFFVEQGMFDDVDALMEELGSRFHGHPRLVEMHEELAAARHLVVSVVPPGEDDIATAVIFTEDPADPGERYLRLGQYDAAIDAYKRLARDPAREVFALTKMGDCYLAKGRCTEAILRYKRALNCDDVTREEIRLLYFQLGTSFERLGDVSEALYFFEKLVKRDPEFRDVSRKIAELISRKDKKAKRA